MTAVGLGMVAQDQFYEFNEIMKERMIQPKALDNSLKLKTGFKNGIIRILFIRAI